MSDMGITNSVPLIYTHLVPFFIDILSQAISIV